MKAEEIIGIALFSDDASEIIKVIQRNIDRQDKDILAACAHAIGHLARRFTVDVSELRDRIMQGAAALGGSNFLAGAIVDMDDDIAHFRRK